MLIINTIEKDFQDHHSFVLYGKPGNQCELLDK